MSEHKNPGCTADSIILYEKNLDFLKTKIPLVKRKNEPYKGFWALPGGFLNYGEETIEQCCVREDWEEIGLIIKLEDLELFGVYSDPLRDPRGHVTSHVYEITTFSGTLKAGDDAAKVRLFELGKLPPLAFDHEKITADYIKKYGVNNE